MMDLGHLQQTAWEIAQSKGLHENLDVLPLREATLVRLALIHTEVSEAAQIVKRYGVETLEHAIDLADELADVLICVGDLAHGLGINLAVAVDRKFSVNRRRPQKFGTPWEEV